MEYNMPWFAAPGPAPYLLATDINDVMLSNVLDAPLLSDAPRSVSLMGAGGVAGGAEQAASGDFAATVPHEFAEWGYQEYAGYDSELKQDELDLDAEEDLGPSGDGRRKPHHNAKKPKVHVDPKLKLKGPITYEKDVDPSLIPIVRDGMARCEKCGALGVRHAFYTRERRYCSLTCARSSEGLSAEESGPGTPEEPASCSAPVHQPQLQVAAPESPGAESVASGDAECLSSGVTPRIDAASGSFSWDAMMSRPPRDGDAFAAAPVRCFTHAPLVAGWDSVCVGLKVEVSCDSGPEPVSWVGTVQRVEGYRGLVRYEGASDDVPGRWMDLATSDVHPVGWCASQGRPLIPPSTLAHRHTDWGQMLVKRLTGARTLPTNHHHRVLRSLSSPLREDQIVEVVDKSCVSQMRAAVVRRVVGRRLHIKYLDAAEDDGGFWCHEQSPLVHPAGWAASVGHRIAAPADYIQRCQTGSFLASDVVDDWAQPPPAGRADGFAVGMKLEALDPLNVSSFGVATVRQVLGAGYLMVRLESLPADPALQGRDWFCYHCTSPYLLPAKFCQRAGIALTPPHGYTEATFTWERYLADTGSAAVPEQLLWREEVQHGFRPGMYLEAVDLLDPQLVCVARISAVVGRLLRVHFTGWDAQYDQWVDVRSPDIFPVGWCRMVGYKLEPPRPGERVAAKARSRKRITKKVVGRRQRPSGGGAAAAPGGEPLPSPASEAALGAARPLGAAGDESASPAALVPDLTHEPPDAEAAAAAVVHAAVSPAAAGDAACPPQIPRLLEPNAAAVCELNPDTWGVQDVGQFLRVNECAAYCDSFAAARVDGRRLLTLTKDQVLELAGWKVGPSLKIENLVQKLRARVAPAKARFMASFRKV